MWLVGGLGILSSVGALAIGFVPPTQIEVGSILFYDMFLVLSFLIMLGLPFLIYSAKKPSWFKNLSH